MGGYAGADPSVLDVVVRQEACGDKAATEVIQAEVHELDARRAESNDWCAARRTDVDDTMTFERAR
jgi:hypothetical protein